MDTETFLNTFYRYANSGYVAITYLAPEGVSVGEHNRAITHFAPMPMQSDLDLSNIHRMNLAGYSVYFRVMVQAQRHSPITLPNGKLSYPRGKADESIFTRVLWGEVDFKTAGEVEATRAIDGMKCPPSIVVRSGGGFHLYWLLNEVVSTNGATYSGVKAKNLYVEPDALKRTLKGIAAAIGCADSSVADIARIMRLPGTINTKPERNGACCEVVTKFPKATYDYRTLEMEYAPLVRTAPARVERSLPQSQIQNLPRWLCDYLQSGAAEGGRNKMLYAAAREYHDLGYSESDAWRDVAPRARMDGLEEYEIEATIGKAYRAPVSVKNPVIAYRDRLLKGVHHD